MADRPTFYIADDWVALLELRPAARTVYGLLRCNAEYNKNAVAGHTVHVTASWFVEMTQHWSKPLTLATVRRGLLELIEKKVVIRLNDPHDGSGYSLAFVADPGRKHEGPVNGFQHAKKVAKRCGMKAYYTRNESDRLGTPAATGVRLSPAKHWGPRPPEQPEPSAQSSQAESREEVAETDGITEGLEEPAGAGSREEAARPVSDTVPEQKRSVSPEMAELARLLVQNCHGRGVNRQGLLEGEALRVAKACSNALAQGWAPDRIAAKLSALVSDGIHSMEHFLIKKAADLGDPPAAPRSEGTVVVKGQEVDLGSIPWGDLPGTQEAPKDQQDTPPPPLPSSSDDEATRERLARLGRTVRRRG